MLFHDLTCSWSKFQIVGTTTENARIPAWVLTLDTENKWKLGEWDYLALGAKESMANIYEGSPEEIG